MSGKERPKMIRLHPFKKKKRGSPFGGQWKEKEKVLMLGGQWKEKEKLPMLGGQWKEKEKVPFYPFSFFPQQIYSNLSIFFPLILTFYFTMVLCRNPTLRQVWRWDSHSQKVGTRSPPGLPKLQSSIVEVKTPRLEVFFIPSESSWSVDVENGLTWPIRTSAAQVMVERRAGSQTGSLTPDH